MLQAAHSLSHKYTGIKPKGAAAAAPLSDVDATALRALAIEDAKCLSYTAMVSTADAIKSINAGFYSWSVVKLYYSLFYSLYACLGFSGRVIFYSGTSPFSIQLSPGQQPHAGGSSSSHKVIMGLFTRHYPNSPILSQNIGFEDPLTWMQHKREYINYKQGKFEEPIIPQPLQKPCHGRTLRTMLIAYLTDSLYTFDPDHAVLAYPLAALAEITLHKGSVTIFDDDDRVSLQSMFSDAQGPMAFFGNLINR